MPASLKLCLVSTCLTHIVSTSLIFSTNGFVFSGAVRRIFAENSSEKEFRCAVINWFDGAKDRSGGPANRRKAEGVQNTVGQYHAEGFEDIIGGSNCEK